jgi:single stranded DNA-binding protein
MRQGGHVTLVGFVATEPRIHQFSDGTAVANLRIGSTARQVDRQTGEWRDGETSFYSVKCWRKLAQNVATCLRKGQPIIVAGKLYTKSYEDRNGQQRSEIEVHADSRSRVTPVGWTWPAARRISAGTGAQRPTPPLWPGARRSGPASTSRMTPACPVPAS